MSKYFSPTAHPSRLSITFRDDFVDAFGQDLDYHFDTQLHDEHMTKPGVNERKASNHAGETKDAA